MRAVRIRENTYAVKLRRSVNGARSQIGRYGVTCRLIRPWGHAGRPKPVHLHEPDVLDCLQCHGNGLLHANLFSTYKAAGRSERVMASGVPSTSHVSAKFPQTLHQPIPVTSSIVKSWGGTGRSSALLTNWADTRTSPMIFFVSAHNSSGRACGSCLGQFAVSLTLTSLDAHDLHDADSTALPIAAPGHPAHAHRLPDDLEGPLRGLPGELQALREMDGLRHPLERHRNRLLHTRLSCTPS